MKKENGILVQFIGNYKGEYCDMEWTGVVLFKSNSEYEVISHYSDADPQDKILMRDLECTKTIAKDYFNIFQKYNIIKQIDITIDEIANDEAEYSIPSNILDNYNFETLK